MSRVRAQSLQLSDVLANGFGKLGVVGAELSPVTASGIVAPCAQAQHEKTKKEKGQDKKGGSPSVKEVQTGLPKLDRQDPATFPQTPRDQSMHLLRELVDEENLRPKSPLMSSVSVAPTGFINITVSPEYLSERLLDIVANEDAAAPLLLDRDFSLISAHSEHYEGEGVSLASPRRVAIDYSSPNIAKEMHVGHIRSTVIGDGLSKLLEFLGFQVTRINHVGDWGTQFGMLIEYFAELERGMHGGLPTVQEVSYLQTFYRAAKQRFDSDADFLTRAKENVVKLQGGDVECRALWRRLCRISEVEFHKVYEQLGIDSRLLIRGESSYNAYLEDVVQEMLDKGIAVEDAGAVMLFPPGVNKDNMEQFRVDGKISDAVVVRKSGGGFTYGATDLASLRMRLCGSSFYHQKNKPDPEEMSRIEQDVLSGGLGQGHEWALYVVDSGQSLHFQRVLSAGKMAGWNDIANANFIARNNQFNIPSTGTAVRVEHVNFGVVLGANGKRLRTRAGEQIKLADLMKESVDSARDVLVEHDVDMDNTRLDLLSQCIGMSSLKYGDLRRNRVSDYAFSFEAMMDMKGDTAVYSMYTHARMFNLLEKALDLPRYSSNPCDHSMIVKQALLAHKQRTSGNDQHCNVPTIHTEISEQYITDLYNSIMLTDKKKDTPQITLAHPSEQQLALHISKFQDAVLSAATSLQMNAITDYTGTLSSKFSAFYRDCSILNAQDSEITSSEAFNTQDSRVMLTLAAVYTLRRCFNLIGIDAVKNL